MLSDLFACVCVFATNNRAATRMNPCLFCTLIFFACVSTLVDPKSDHLPLPPMASRLMWSQNETPQHGSPGLCDGALATSQPHPSPAQLLLGEIALLPALVPASPSAGMFSLPSELHAAPSLPSFRYLVTCHLHSRPSLTTR